MENYLRISELDSISGNYRNALQHFKKYSVLRDSIFNRDKSRIITELQSQYDYEKTEKEILLLKKDQEIKAEIIKNQRILNFSIAFIMLLIMIIAFLLLIQFFRIRRKNFQLDKQRKEINESIGYSKHIQKAIFPADEYIKSILPDSFIFFQPREIIGGDFYWVSKVNGSIIVAAGDCTGHGIPGALMSMLGTTFLNEIVLNKEITNPGEILDRMRMRLISTLHQSDARESSDDGIDIALINYNPEKNELCYAGANNPLIICRDNEIIEVKADKMSLRYSHHITNDFSVQNIVIKGNEMLYLFSDGYADQFGGSERKKFLKGNFKNLLLEISTLPIDLQQKKLEETFKNWKGPLEQIDDVLVIGIKLK